MTQLLVKEVGNKFSLALDDQAIGTGQNESELIVALADLCDELCELESGDICDVAFEGVSDGPAKKLVQHIVCLHNARF